MSEIWYEKFCPAFIKAFNKTELDLIKANFALAGGATSIEIASGVFKRVSDGATIYIYIASDLNPSEGPLFVSDLDSDSIIDIKELKELMINPDWKILKYKNGSIIS